MSQQEWIQLNLNVAAAAYWGELDEPDHYPDLGARWSLGLSDQEVLEEIVGDPHYFLEDLELGFELEDREEALAAFDMLLGV